MKLPIVLSRLLGVLACAVASAAWALPPSVFLTFSPTTIALGGTSQLQVQIFDDGSGLGFTGGTIALGSLTLTPGLVYTSTPIVSSTCTGTASPTSGTGSFSLSGATGTCILVLEVTASVASLYSASIPAGGFTASTGSNGFSTSATLAATPPLVVTNTADSGAGSLRQVLTDANTICVSGPSITFNIPGTGPHVIVPTTELPPASCNGTLIDACTQPGAQPNTAVDGTNNAIIQVEIDGSSCASCNGITSQSSATIRGLAIHSFSGAQIYAHGDASVFGNYIGADAAGVALGGGDGILTDTFFLQVGSGASGDMNFITGLTHAGIWAASSTSGTQITLNQIGGSRNGSSGAGNGIGVLLDYGSNTVNNNFIRYNGGAGIVVTAGYFFRNIFSANSTFGNGGPGIDLNDDGPTPNDESAIPYDTDTGPNQLVNYPVITSIVYSGADTVVSGHLRTTPGSTATIQIYQSSAAPPAGVTQGETLIASFPLTLDVNGEGLFSQTILGSLVNNLSAADTVDTCGDGCTYSSEYSPNATIVPAVSLTPATVAFGGQPVGTTSAPVPVTLANTGSSPLVISSIAASGDFSFSSACPGTLAGGASCTIDAAFAPLVLGARTGAITIVSDAPGSPHIIGLSGTGLSPLSPHILVSVAALDFGPQALGTQSGIQVVVIMNSGTAPLSFGQEAVSGDFVDVPDLRPTTYTRCGAPLNPGEGCAFAIAFAPTAEGVRQGTLSIVTNDFNSPTRIALAGTGSAASPRLLAVPSSLIFGSQPVGTTSAGLPLPIDNGGASVASITELTASGDFTVSDTCATIPAGGRCSPLVFFTPTVTGLRTGTLVIRSFSETLPYVVNLTGEGAPNLVPQVSLSATHVGFGNTALDLTSSAKVVVTNVGQLPVTLGVVAATGDFLVAHECGSVIPVAGACTLNVSFLPRIVGPASGILSILTDAFGSPHQVQLSGVGCALPSIVRARSGQPVCGS